MERHVKGFLFVDYVRMLRSRKDLDRTHLEAVDLPYLTERVHPEAWYPMETFARFGLAILGQMAHGDLFVVRAWGRLSVDHVVPLHSGLLVDGDPRESLMRFVVLRKSFFDFDATSIPKLSDGHASVQVHYGMTERAWKGDPETIVEINWEKPA